MGQAVFFDKKTAFIKDKIIYFSIGKFDTCKDVIVFIITDVQGVDC